MKKNTVPAPLPAKLSAGLGLALAAVLAAAPGQAQTPAVTKGVTTSRPVPATQVAARVSSGTDFATVGPTLDLTIGKSTLLRMPSAVERVSVGNPHIADVTLISPTELYLLGKTYGSTNMIVWRKGAGATAVDLNVNIDYERMEKKINELMPEEKGIRVRPAADSVILTGMVSSAAKARYAEDIANAYVRDVNKSLVLPILAGDTRVEPGTRITIGRAGAGGGGAAAATGAAGAKVVNLLRIAEAQQVMLEVTVAEVSKTLLDKLGARFNLSRTNGNWTFGILSDLRRGGAGGLLSAIKNSNNTGIKIDAQKDDGLVKILAEPNIVAVSGQEASFLAGGRVFIPVPSDDIGGRPKLEEKEFGVGVKFTPTVLEGGRIHLKVAPEVSELSETGAAVQSGSLNAVLPLITTRKVQTSVQLMDGQSLAIAGLIKNNINEAVKRVPGLGEVPVLGALFRSSEFKGDRSELMFVITPRLVKPLEPNYILPTDSYTPPSRSEFYLGNKLEGSGHEDVPADKRDGAPANPAPAPATGGMEVK